MAAEIEPRRGCLFYQKRRRSRTAGKPILKSQIHRRRAISVKIIR
jgi:hypothetical protein